MTETEEYFPRGGKKPTGQYLKQSTNFLGTAEKKERKKKQLKKKSETDDGYLSDDRAKEEDNSFINCAVGLSYNTVKAGMLVLGRVCTVYETKIKVMLPGKTQGMVMACYVSEPYNKLLEAYVNDQMDSMRELKDMFRPGQFVAVKIMEVNDNQLMLSMMPQHVNDGKTQRDLYRGCLLQAAVSSEEDHGYVMDVGIASAKAFLPKKNANPEIDLAIGSLTWVVIKFVVPSSEHSVVTLTNHLDAIQSGILMKSPSTALLPATSLNFVVDKSLRNGIEGHIFNDKVSYVQRNHVDTQKGKPPALGEKVRARVLYVMPTKKTPFLTLKNIFECPYPDLTTEQKFHEGDIIEKAMAIKITGRAVWFRLDNLSTGTLSIKRITVDEDLTDEAVVAKQYPIGSKHRVRVLCYHLSDYIYSVSDEPSILNEKYFNVSQMSAGQMVTATVTQVTDGKVTVNVGRITGYIPKQHWTDAGVFVDPKKATSSTLTKKKFKVGSEIQARVLSVDSSKGYLLLTTKPTLLKPDIEVLSEYHQAQVGKAYSGIVKFVRGHIIVSFFNFVTAYVPRHYVTKDADINIQEAFHLGQIVNCTILKVDPEKEKLYGSLVTAPFWPEKKRERSKRHHSDTETHNEPPTKKNRQVNNDKDFTKEGETENKRKKKRDKTNSESENQSEIEDKTKSKAKKNKVIEEITDVDRRDIKKKKKITEEADNATETVDIDSKKKKRDKKPSVSEDSDAIETDIYEEEVLTPEEQSLIDLSDCDSAKKFKRRIVSLVKAIKARTQRIDKIENKIATIENKGLTPKTKKYHTSMHMEKLLVEERIKKLMQVLSVAQERYKEFGVIVNNNDYKNKKTKGKQNKNEDEIKEEIKEVKVQNEVKVKADKIKIVGDLEPVLEAPSAKDFWSATADALTQNVENNESSSGDEEHQELPNKKRKKLTVAEKEAKIREEEERVRDMERRAIESQAQPRSTEQFERALLASPDCSQLWIAYMAFHLQATEIEKARAVGRKALNTINFREEEERLNVWLALLNCEHRFGTKETQKKTLEEALQMNDTFKIHSQLLDILVETSKHQELSSLVDLMLRKYKQNPQNYILCGDACFKLGLVNKARQVMQKAVSVLEKKEHVNILVKFALMERSGGGSGGGSERAEALFEQVLAVYPHRVDVCNVYVDMLHKAGDADRIRQVMERMTSQKLPARKMKFLYKKWIEIEEKLGDQEQAEAVRRKALEFIDRAKF